MSVNRRASGAGHRCSPATGEIICVEARRLDRSKVHEHFSTDEMRKAIAREKQIKAEPHAPGTDGGATLSSIPTFEDYAELWCSAQKVVAPATLRNPLHRAYKAVTTGRPFGQLSLTNADIDSLRVKALETALFAAGYKYSSVTTSMSIVKRVLRQAVADDRLARDPTVGHKMSRRDTLDAGGVVTPDDVTTHPEVLAIIDGAPERGRFGVVMGFGAGMRIGEILGFMPYQFTARIRKPDLIRIVAQHNERGRVGPKTRRGVRTIELSDPVAAAVRRAIKGKAHDAVLLGGRRGGQPRRGSFYDQIWYPAQINAGILIDRRPGPGQREGAYNFHVTRHYAVSAMLARGVPAVEVAAYVGDALPTLNAVYAHWLRDAPGLAKGALDAALGPVPLAPNEGDEQIAEDG